MQIEIKKSETLPSGGAMDMSLKMEVIPHNKKSVEESLTYFAQNHKRIYLDIAKQFKYSEL